MTNKFNEMEGGGGGGGGGGARGLGVWEWGVVCCSNDSSMGQVLWEPRRKDYNVFQNFILFFVLLWTED